MCDKGAVSLGRLRQAAGSGSLRSQGVCMGAHLGNAMAVRCAASLAAAFLGIPRSPDFGTPYVGDVRVGGSRLREPKGEPPESQALGHFGDKNWMPLIKNEFLFII